MTPAASSTTKKKIGIQNAPATTWFIVRRKRPSRGPGLRSGRAHEGQVSAARDTRCPQSGQGIRVLDAIAPATFRAS